MRKHRSLVTETVFFFPEEILYEILSWLGVESLLRCKSVCKDWYAVIRNKQFVDLHAIRNVHRFCDIQHVYKSLKRKRVKERIKHLNTSCGGLIIVQRVSLTSDPPSASYHINNPTTRRILDLPQPNKGVVCMQIFLNFSTSSYNVVSVYHDKDRKEKLELIDLGGQSNDPGLQANFSWRTLNISEFYELSGQLRYHFIYRMSLQEGVLYILALDAIESSNPLIICIDLVNEACLTYYTPQSLLFNWFQVNFQLLKGKPSVLYVLEEKLNIWILEDYKTGNWADKIIILSPFLKQNPTMKRVFAYIYENDEEDALVYGKDGQNYRVCKLESKALCTVPPPTLRVLATLVSVKGMQPVMK